MRKGQTALDALEILARHLVAHDVSLFAIVQLLAGTTLVDTHHGDTDGPGRLSDAEA